MADSNGYGGGHAHYEIKRTYKLIGTPPDGESEEIECDIADMDTAETLKTEYEMAYRGWTIAIEEE